MLRTLNHDRVIGLLNQVKQKSPGLSRKFDKLPAKVSEAQRLVIAALEQSPQTKEKHHKYRPIVADLFDWIRFGLNKLEGTSKNTAIIKKE